MKTINYFISICLCLCLAACNSNNEPEEEETVIEEPSPELDDEPEEKKPIIPCSDLEWDYPVKPGMPEWAIFTTGAQKWDACQIPGNILEALCAKELVKICLDFPMFIEFTAVNDERVGTGFMIKNFNGFSELSKRMDGVLELMNAYKEYPVLTQIPEKSSEDYFTPIKLPWIELLLADEAFIKQLNEQESAELEQIVVEKYVLKVENMHVYSIWSIKQTFLLYAVNVLNYSMTSKTPQQQETIRRFIENYVYADETLLTEMSKIISGL